MPRPEAGPTAGDPAEERETFRTASGDVVLYKFTVQHGRPNERYSVQYMDYTEKRMKELRTAEELLKKAGLPVVPGMEGPLSQEPNDIVKVARTIGYPVIIKASGGGGGRGASAEPQVAGCSGWRWPASPSGSSSPPPPTTSSR